MAEISKVWKKRDGYKISDAAYLVLGMSPQSPDIKPPYEVEIAIGDIKKTLKRYYPETLQDIEKNPDSTGVGRLIVITLAEYYGATDFFKDDPLLEQARKLLHGDANSSDNPEFQAALNNGIEFLLPAPPKLLQIVYGMAIDKYGYDPKSSRNSATGGNRNSISSSIQAKCGISVDNETIKKYLDAAKKIIEIK